MFVFSPLSGSNLIDLFDNEEQDGISLVQLTAQVTLLIRIADGNIDLINFLILDEGYLTLEKAKI